MSVPPTAPPLPPPPSSSPRRRSVAIITIMLPTGGGVKTSLNVVRWTAVEFKCAQRRLLTTVCRTLLMSNVAAPVKNRFFRNYVDFETLVFASATGATSSIIVC